MSDQFSNEMEQFESRLPKKGFAITSEVTGNTYIIGNYVGSGNFSYVYDCEDVWENKLVAKILKPNPLVSGNLEQVAFDELQKLLHVRHPNVVHVFDAFKYNQNYYIISEKCLMTLKDYIFDEKCDSYFWVPAIAKCLLQAVHFSHVQGIVHCDIHEGNVFAHAVKGVLFSENPPPITFKLGDFGLSKLAANLDPNGVFLEGIRPPEAIENEIYGPIDSRLDIYHICLLLLRILLKKSTHFTRDEIISGLPRELSMNLKHPFSHALEKGLRRRVLYRTSNALEVWRDLNSPNTKDRQID